MAKSCTFEHTSFAEGRFRLAYKGKMTSPPALAGQKIVVKESKDSYTWKSTDWDKAVEIHKAAKTMASSFNRVHNCTLSIRYVDIDVFVVTTSGSSGPQLHEHVLVEDYLPGTFTKWCNNYGYISSSSELLPAFMHWSWYESGGQKMIADLQGVRTAKEYLLTDPVIMSNSFGGKYGCTDTGVEGIAMFFLKHKCNQFCNRYPKPTVQDVVTTSEANRQIASLSTSGSTAYSHELKIPEYLKTRMTAIFPNIATGQR